VAGTNATASLSISSFTAAETGSGESITFVDANHNYYYIAAAAFGFDYNFYQTTTDQGYHSPNLGNGYTLNQWTASFANLVNTQASEIGVTVVTGAANTLQFTGSVAVNGLRIYTDLFYGEPTGSKIPAQILGGGTPSVNSNTLTLATLGKGKLFNNSTAVSDAGAENSDGSLLSGSTDNVRWEIQNVDNSQGTFTLLVRQGNDSRNNPIILETFNNLSLDPNSPNYVEAVIGNQYKAITPDSGGNNYLGVVGTYPNRSNYIRVSSVERATPNYLANNGITVNTDINGTSYSASLPQPGSGSFYGAVGEVKSGANYFASLGTGGTGEDAQGLVGDNYTTAINLLTNKDDYQFNIISTPGLIYGPTAQGGGTRNAKNVIDSVISLAESRGDCIAVVDLVPTGSAVSAVTAQAATVNSSYAATYWPWVQIQSATGQNQYVPAGTIIPGVYAFTDAASAPWFAPAGLIRGGLPGVIQAERKLTKADRDTLYLGKVNPIATFPGTVITVF
jgi:hypothetical protein